MESSRNPWSKVKSGQKLDQFRCNWKPCSIRAVWTKILSRTSRSDKTTPPGPIKLSKENDPLKKLFPFLKITHQKNKKISSSSTTKFHEKALLNLIKRTCQINSISISYLNYFYTFHLPSRALLSYFSSHFKRISWICTTTY